MKNMPPYWMQKPELCLAHESISWLTYVENNSWTKDNPQKRYKYMPKILS